MDPYKILGIESGATVEQAKKAYRKLAHQHHPDKNPGNAEAEAKFKEINEAWDRIQNPGNYKREAPPQSNNGFGFDFHDIFNGFSGFNRGGPRQPIYQAVLNLTFEEAALGVSKKVQYSKTHECAPCGGVGGEKDGFTQCGHCHGRGVIERKTKFFGTEILTCPACRGRKVSITKPCASCKGSGKTVSMEIADFIPEHGLFHHGQKVQLENSNGDVLHITLNIGGHSSLTRANEDILGVKELTLGEALMGCSVPVHTIHGEVIVKIKPLTNPGTNVRLQGKGAKTGHDAYGNHIVKIKVSFPQNISEEQKNKLKEVIDDIYGKSE